jgi:formate/nitrite transporter
MNGINSPKEVAEGFVGIGQVKAALPIWKQLLLGILAGAFIAFAAEASSAATHAIANAGLAKCLAGTLFAGGLMLVVICGAELFTGNCLMVIAASEKAIKVRYMLKNWLFVYIGNFIGAMIIVLVIRFSGQLDMSSGLLGAAAIKTAVSKTSLTFVKALLLGIGCNWLVCLAVWMASAAKDAAGKILGIFFPIWLFITSGFEHCVANMYYIPVGILAKTDPNLTGTAIEAGLSQAQLDNLTWGSFITANLIPVTIGNIIGGAFFVGIAYWLAYVRKTKKERKAQY